MPVMVPPLLKTLFRGFSGHCPRCGCGRVLHAYLRVVDRCSHCGEVLGHIRADDGPAYFTLFAVAHLVVPVALWVERGWAPPMLPFVAAAMVATAVLIAVLLPAFKGATVALMWRLRLRGDEHQGDGVPD
ncbi:DUF983 domain-containing protein [Magnetospirillum sulfuroxidans]|uniref:DUF983 domain-containing protein n=1 Tax=Magnetospirillum sulfuroxidans TaxID=611300 RepID=A0ABS5I6T4_9PROT|nr:DUF983 domain-containing protein [Magnetospirillum sulfuroxidans]MBR9970127.1 DUF983 domain-containing protein [Magnetospirillum sulfuroxidans]